MKSIAIVLTAAVLLSLVPVSARAQNNSGGAFLGALAGALIGGILSRHFELASDRREQAELDSIRRTTEDETALKTLATSLEEFAVDHNGAYPATLNDLSPLYLNRQPWIPESNPPASYRYENPAERPEWGKWDIVDNGAFDPTLHNLRSPDGNVCTHETCKYILYAQSIGLIGAPADHASPHP